MDAVVCGASWTYGRHGCEKQCIWCGKNDTAWHRYWECSRLHSHQSEFVTRSNHYASMFATSSNDPLNQAWAPCLWARGLLPVSLGRWKGSRAWEEDIIKRQTSNFIRLASEVDHYATDGSGGPSFVPESLQRMGSAVAILKAHEDALGKVTIQDAAALIAKCQDDRLFLEPSCMRW